MLKQLANTEDLQIALNCRAVSYEAKKKEFIYGDSLQQLHCIKSDCVINCAGTVGRAIEFIPSLPGKVPAVDKYMRLQGFSDIFAVGDCAASEFLHPGSYTDAIYSGTVAGSNIAGVKVQAVKKIRELRVTFNELKLYSAGEVLDAHCRKVVKTSGNTLQKLYYRQDKLIGCTLINDLRDSSRYYQAIAGLPE
jgi:NADH dehydrogenase FAD-containing subunit